MTDNPGAGNVLLRTLATILAQRLRQVDPQFYGLGAYGVVDTPGLPPAPEAIAEELETTEVPTASEVSKPATTYGTMPEEDDASRRTHRSPASACARARLPLPDPDELEPL